MLLRTGLRATLMGLAACAALAGGAKAHKPHQIKVLHSLCQGPSCPHDGGDVRGGLAMDADGNFFGFTEEGGIESAGTAFELYREPGKKKWKFQTIYNFCALNDCADGEFPELQAPIMDTAGNVYGTTTFGGTSGHGVFFELTPSKVGKQWKLTVLYNFCSKNSVCNDGGDPLGTLTYQGAAAGALYDGISPLYGTTTFGGAHGFGTAFLLKPQSGNWHEHVLYAFCAEGGTSCTDGTDAFSVSLDAAGDLVGLARRPADNHGFVFRLTPNPSGRLWTQTILYNFCSLADCADGWDPSGSVVEDASGNIYGVADAGGNAACDDGTGCGVLYKIAPDNSETVLHEFCAGAHCADGAFPHGTLLIDSLGTLYGTTVASGPTQNAGGTVYKWSQTTGLHVLWTFCETAGCPDGESPFAGVTADATGNLFGSTESGGALNEGTLFELHQ